MKETGLYIYRRHLRGCRFFGRGGRDARLDKCNCPFHVDGIHRARRVREALKTRGRQLADRRLAERIREIDTELDREAVADCNSGSEPARAQRTVSEAVEHFLRNKGSVEPNGLYRGDVERGTYRKYAASLTLFSAFCKERGILKLEAVDLDVLEDFRRTRRIAPVTWKVERQTLVTFFSDCVRRKWIAQNPAKDLKPPRLSKPNDVEPYTLAQEGRILGACELIGGGKHNRSGARYEQLRARAMILLLRSTALRISDVATLPKDAVAWDPAAETWRVRLRTQKSGEPVYLPIPEYVKLALDALPMPRNAAQDCPYYFWNGQTSRRAVVGIAERTLATVFKKSGVRNAHAHRFRHTLATRLLEHGATTREVADILGNTEQVVVKHYAKWSKGRQDKIDRLMFDHFATAPATLPVTKRSHEKMGAVN